MTLWMSADGGLGITRTISRISGSSARPVVLVDLDLARGDLMSHVGVEARTTLGDLAGHGVEAIDSDMVAAVSWAAGAHRRVIASPGCVELGELVDGDLVRRVLQIVSVSGSDDVHVDGGSVLDARTLSAALLADHIILRVTGSVMSQRRCRTLVDVLCRAGCADIAVLQPARLRDHRATRDLGRQLGLDLARRGVPARRASGPLRATIGAAGAG